MPQKKDESYIRKHMSHPFDGIAHEATCASPTTCTVLAAVLEQCHLQVVSSPVVVPLRAARRPLHAESTAHRRGVGWAGGGGDGFGGGGGHFLEGLWRKGACGKDALSGSAGAMLPSSPRIWWALYGIRDDHGTQGSVRGLCVSRVRLCVTGVGVMCR